MPADMIIFTRTYDILKWILPRAIHFPKQYRTTVTQRLKDAALDFQETIVEANAFTAKLRLRYLRQADGHLAKVRLYLRLAFDWEWLTAGQHQHISQMVNEVGRLLGGWISQTEASI